ncbi:MAG: nucleotidyltransferase family protein [Spirochaetales bacterium]|nr:nucleotidyltransferase family protein [Spirochaetales bacterium]
MNTDILSVAKDMAYLSACMINGIVPDTKRVSGMDIAALHELAKAHLLTGIVGYALEAAGITDPKFSRDKAKAIRKVALFDVERTAVLDELEKAGIAYMMLKGCVLEGLYPKIGMRQMADNDILYDRTRCEDVKAIMEKLGFEAVNFVHDDYNHDQYQKKPVFNFEMHRALFSPSADGVVFKYYEDIQSRMIPDDGKKFSYHLSDEDFYLYMIAHEHKHFSGGGTGMRSLLDTYVCLKKLDLDMDYIRTEAEKLGLRDFEEKNRLLALHLFDDLPLSDDEQAMFEYILSSGTYGTLFNSVTNEIEKHGRLGYLFSRLTLPYDAMKTRYPVLEKCPVLYPFCWVHRILHGFVTNRKVVMYQVKTALFGKTSKRK